MGSEPTSTIERAVENETVFRRVNDDIRAAAEGMPGMGEGAFVCECSDPGCRETIALGLADYAWIRAHPTYFLVAPGHEEMSEEHERIVRFRLEFSVVEKLGYAAALATAAYRNGECSSCL